MDKRRIMEMATFILIISFGFSTIISLVSLSSLINKNDEEESIIYANQISNEITATFSEPRAVSLSFDNTFIHEILGNFDSYSEEEISTILGEYLLDNVEDFNYDTGFIVSANNYGYYTEHGFHKILEPTNPDDDWIFNFLESGKDYELNLDNDQANGNRTTVFINCKMTDDEGNFIGACGVGLTLDDISEILGKYETLEGYSLVLADKDGNITVSSAELDGQITDKASAHQGMVSNELVNTIKNYDKSKSHEYVTLGKNSFFIVKYIPDCDWYLIIDYEGNDMPSVSTILTRNMLACLISLVVVLVATNAIISYSENRSKKYKDEAERDMMTGLKNRREYERKLEEFRKLRELENITVISLDVNGLKYVNDNIGHAAGDELIKGSASVIDDFFKDIGFTYRTGGDEFMVLINDCVDNPEKLATDFKAKVATWKGKLVDEIHISIGIARGADKTDDSLEALLREADKAMYIDKAKYYEDNKIDRRQGRR